MVVEIFFAFFLEWSMAVEITVLILLSSTRRRNGLQYEIFTGFELF